MFRTVIVAGRPMGRARAGLGVLVTALGVTALGLAGPGVAHAAPAVAGTGGLVYAGCIGDRAGCTPTTPAGLAASGGTHLYAAAFTGSVVSHFAIARFSARH